MPELPCDDLRDLLPEAALDLLDEPTRGETLRHVGACPGCRHQFEQLVAAADQVMALAPEAEPPAGFEQRVLARLDAAAPRPVAVRSPRRVSVLVAAAAAVVALLVGGAIGVAVTQDGNGDGYAALGIDDLATTTLRNGDGDEVGRAAISREDVPVLLVHLDRSRPGVTYGCQLVLADGATVPVGEWTTPGDAGGGWAAPMPTLAAQPVEVQITGASGGVWASGTLQ